MHVPCAQLVNPTLSPSHFIVVLRVRFFLEESKRRRGRGERGGVYIECRVMWVTIPCAGETSYLVALESWENLGATRKFLSVL